MYWGGGEGGGARLVTSRITSSYFNKNSGRSYFSHFLCLWARGNCSDAPFKSSCLSVYDLRPNNPFREHSPLDIPNQQCSNIPSKEGEALLLT